MVSAAVRPSIAVMSIPRAPTTRPRTWSPSSHSKLRTSSTSGAYVTELGRLLVGIGFVGHRAATDLGSGEVLQQPGRPQRRMELDVERVVGMIAHRGLVYREHVGHADAPQRVVAVHDVTQDGSELVAPVVVEVGQRRD